MVEAARAALRVGSSERAKKLGGGPPPPAGTIALHIGDPSFVTPDYIRDAAIEAIRAGYTHYPPASGDAQLRQALADQLSTQGGGSFRPDDVFITNGANSALYAAMVAYLDPGDEVLLHDPTYSLYQDIALAIGATVVQVPWSSDLHLDVDALEKAVTPRTRMFVLNNPCNPTGIVLTQAETRAVADFVLRHDLLLVADEAYDHLVYDGRRFVSMASYAELAENAIVVNTCSKTFAMTGWRVGYMAARGGLLKPAGDIHRTALGTVNWIAQRAAVAAFTHDPGWKQAMLAEFTKRRDLMWSMVNDISGLSCAKPEGTFYAFPRVEVPLTSEQLSDHLTQQGVAVRSGTEYGPRGEGFIRLSFAGEIAQFKPGLERLAEAMHSLHHVIGGGSRPRLPAVSGR
jgi:aspartate/methionine/tyrosine aminotransferase